MTQLVGHDPREARFGVSAGFASRLMRNDKDRRKTRIVFVFFLEFQVVREGLEQRVRCV